MLSGNHTIISVKEILFSLTAIIIVLLVPHSGIIPVPFGYSIPILVFVWFFLKRRHENFTTIGFSFKRFEVRSALVGALAGILIFSFLTWAFFPLLEKIITLPKVELGDFLKIREDTGFFVFILIMSWVVGGFYEELIFHGFIFTQFEKILPGKNSVLLSFLLTNIIFGLYHSQLGISGVLNAFLAGSAYHALMLFYKRNMWYAIFCHAVFDTIALTLIYVGYL